MSLLSPPTRQRLPTVDAHKREQAYLFIAISILLLYVFPYLILGEGAYVTIHDILDADFLYLYMLKISGQAFNFDPNALLPNMMNGGPSHGVPRSAFRSGLNLEVLSFYLLPGYTAYVLNLVIIHGIGFWGMYLLLKRYVLPEPTWAFTRVTIALLFALVPYSIVHGISVSGQPLLLLAFLNLLNRKQHWTDWLIIALFPFYSFFVWSGLFIVIALAIIGLMSIRQRRAVNWPYIGGLTLLGGLYLLTEWQMIYGFLAKVYVSQRTEYDYARLMPVTVADSLRKSFQLFVRTQYHSGEYITVLIIGTAVIASWRVYWQANYALLRQMVVLLVVAVAICLFSGFYVFPAVWLGPGNLTQSFQFDRFYFLLPLLWLYVFALALRTFPPNGWLNRLLLLGQFVLILGNNKEFRINVGKLTGVISEQSYPSYRAFYSTKLLGQIRDYIGRSQASYRIVNIGMHPAVAQYNGFYTLDSYQNNYPLSYKHTFRRVIENELEKAEPIKTYYDAYGCRCYTYCAELGMATTSFLVGKHQNRPIQRLELNMQALRDLGGEYVFSAVPIRNAADNDLRLERVFDDKESYWRVWLYKIENKPARGSVTKTGGLFRLAPTWTRGVHATAGPHS